MPYRARVARVAASNTPTNPGELGSATPKPMIPCSKNAPTAGTGSPNARKHTAKAAAFTSQSTTDQSTTPKKRPGLLSTSSPATSPSAIRMTRSATRAGNSAWVARPSSASQGAGRCTTNTATTSTTPKKAAAVVVIADTDVLHCPRQEPERDPEPHDPRPPRGGGAVTT